MNIKIRQLTPTTLQIINNGGNLYCLHHISGVTKVELVLDNIWNITFYQKTYSEISETIKKELNEH